MTELEWNALIPDGWQPLTIVAQRNAAAFEGDDARAQELTDELQALWRNSPVVEELDGKRVKLPGFVVTAVTPGSTRVHTVRRSR